MFSTLLRRDGVYYLRRVVPKSLRETLGQREVKISLKTRNVEEAKRRLKVESLRVDRLFEEARRSPSPPMRACTDWYRRRSKITDAGRVTLNSLRRKSSP